MRDTRSLLFIAVLWSALPVLTLFTGCASPPKLAQCDDGDLKPLNGRPLATTGLNDDRCAFAS